MKIQHIHGLAPLYTNTFLITTDAGHGIIVDPAAAPETYLQELEKEELCKEKLLWLMEKRRKVVSILPFVSYGSAELMENECIRDTKIRADQKMYEDKKEHKERKCR